MTSMWKVLKQWFIEMGSPPLFYNWSSKIIPWLGIATLVLLSIGIFWGLFVSPIDYKQGDVYRILYIHVPSAILGESIFIFIAINVISNFLQNIIILIV